MPRLAEIVFRNDKCSISANVLRLCAVRDKNSLIINSRLTITDMQQTLFQDSEPVLLKTAVSRSVLPDNFWEIFGLRPTSDTVLINLHFLWLKKTGKYSEKDCSNMQNWAIWEAFNLKESHPSFPKNPNIKGKQFMDWYNLVLKLYQSKNWYEIEYAKQAIYAFELKRLEIKRTILENGSLTDG